MKMASNGIDVYVKLPSGKAIELKQLPANTVRDIARKVAESEKVPERRVRLKYQGKTLDKNKTIGYLGVRAETILKAEVIFPKKVPVSIQEEGSDAVQLEVETTDTLAQLRDTVRDITGIVTHDQQLKVSGVLLTGDSAILCDCGVTEGSVISVGRVLKSDAASPDQEDEVVDEETRQRLLGTFDASGRRVDVVFSFDTTGSMSSCLANLDWAEDSAKALVIIGDDVPHTVSFTDQHVFWKDELDVLTGMDVKVYGVHALSTTHGEPFYRELADRSGGYYLKLKDLKLITDMFLAVCYREAEDGRLEAFVEEVEREGRMCEDTKDFLDALEDKPTSSSKSTLENVTSKRCISEAWWDPSLDRASQPSYAYDLETDKWRPYNAPRASSCLSTPIPEVRRRKKSFKRFLCFCGK
ncbi:UBIQP-like protein [Mya arenaria]|uniref:UBIQP-like protein n=1 Tax=Mya arenaria TaxID=6604 RepID=A0ABY7DUB8_MYAAR|nr:UBIQP-like protein [Mya arenaria]